MTDDLIAQIFLQLPNFLGLFYAVWILKEQNLSLLSTLREERARHDGIVENICAPEEPEHKSSGL